MDKSRLDGWGAFIEGPSFPVVAGPCSAESREQVLETASELRARGVMAFRAGAWKPRTRPGAFEGRGESALEWLVQAKVTTGMAVGTEAASACHVGAILSAGLDFIWIGARTTANPFLVQEIADALRGADIPVFVKNPVSPDVDLWAGAIERLQQAGISRVAAIHRGVTSYSRILYRNDPHWQMPIALRIRYPRLPMFCDPSHIAGDRKYIDEISRKAMDLDFDGLFIEAHINPERALSDAAQQITPAELADLLLSLVPKETDCDSPEYHESIEQLRAKIDEIDDNLVSLLADRMEASGKIGWYKKENSVSVLQSDRWDTVMSRVLSRAEAYGLDKEFIKDIFNRIHQASIEKQENF